jgi:PKD repeat protein
MKPKSWIHAVVVLGLLLSPWLAAPRLGEPARAQGGTVWYVKPAATGNCLSWATACELQTALTASAAGDQIRVAAGTYKPTTGTDRSATFLMRAGVGIYGGFAGTETSRDQRNPNPATNGTVLSGDIGIPNNSDDNVYHVVSSSGVTETAVLDGFTINGGNANGPASSDDSGGGMYNYNSSSPTLANVAFSGNTGGSGGGMANFGPASAPSLYNSILWANSSEGSVAEQQVYDASGASHAVNASTIQDADLPSPFVDADGADNIPGTADDDLHPGYPSYGIIDGGSKTYLPPDEYDLDGDGDDIEPLPLDLDGHADPAADSVDQGAYEAGCWAWHMVTGDDYLAEGRKYRLGFHYEIDQPSSVTVADTLGSYAAERAAGNLAKAKTSYEIALDCAATVTETNQAIAGLLNVTWEQATGAMLEGNEQMVTALDLTDADDIGAEITALQTAVDKYDEASAGYLLPLATEHQGDFLAAMEISRTYPITYTSVITQVDVQRLASVMAQESRANLELALGQFRQGDREAAEATLRQAKLQADVELALLFELWPGVAEDANYTAVLRNLSDMDRLLGFLAEGKNALGYSPEWAPIHYQPGTGRNNYEQTNLLAEQKVGDAVTAVGLAATESEKVHDNYTVMQERYDSIRIQYDAELVELCGADATSQPDLARCEGGTIAFQISAVEQAQLRLQRVLEQMNVLHKRIDIEVEARAKAAGIYESTAELIDPDTSKKYTSLMDQQHDIALGWKIAKGVGGIVSGGVSGLIGGKKISTGWGIVGAIGGALGPAIDLTAGLFGGEDTQAGPPKDELLLEFQAYQNAQVLICDGKIKDLEFETKIKELFLEYGPLQIDYTIGLENLHQELLRLQGMTTRAEYLLAEKDRAMAFTQLLYQDPAHRVLRDQYMEEAQDAYDVAVGYVFQAGRALEYEANLSAQELAAPDPDALLGVRNVNTLSARRQQTKTAYDDWSEDKIPHTYVTDDPYPKVLLSRATGYEDTDIPGIGPVTAEEQFNAYVIRNPANRYDLDEDGTAESLYFTFGTPVHKGNPFFDHCLFNDRILAVKIRIRGQSLGTTSATVRLGWGDTRCSETECGTTFIRSEEAFTAQDEYDKYLDDLRPYKVRPKLATVQAVTGDIPFPPGAENYDLATRSVANPTWTFFIDGTLPANAGLNLDNVDEIELILTHEAYSLQSPICVAPPLSRLVPFRDYQPMERVLDPMSNPLLAALGEERSLQATAEATSLSGSYFGAVDATLPQYMPPFDLNLVLTDTEGSLTGYIDAAQGLHYPVVDEATGRGPAVSGSWSGETFGLQSEPFTTALDPGPSVTRQVILHSGVISDSGEVLTASYTETVAGLTPEPMVISGTVQLSRLPAAIAPAADFGAFPAEGPVPLIVSFSDLSIGDPTNWSWNFGDGATSTEQHPVHTYTAQGTYDVTLTVGNAQGSHTTVKPGYISVTAPGAPVAYFSASPLSGPAPLTVTFNDLSAGGPTAWLWNFGDGGTSTAQHPTHIYRRGGVYAVCLTVTNALGTDTRTAPDYITVVGGPEIYLPLVLRKAP